MGLILRILLLVILFYFGRAILQRVAKRIFEGFFRPHIPDDTPPHGDHNRTSTGHETDGNTKQSGTDEDPLLQCPVCETWFPTSQARSYQEHRFCGDRCFRVFEESLKEYRNR
ncbi:MAG: hypothetical protein HQL50_04675 [Magnetococcales bacterium]|nr:hypothetical protein [Magnetococcales bacterium]